MHAIDPPGIFQFLGSEQMCESHDRRIGYFFLITFTIYHQGVVMC